MVAIAKPRGGAGRFARGRKERLAERARSPLGLYCSDGTTESLLGRRAAGRRLSWCDSPPPTEWRGWFETAVSDARECAVSPARLALLVLLLLLCWLCLHARSVVAGHVLAPGTAGAGAPPRRRFCLVLDAAALSDASEGVSHIRLLAALSRLSGAELHVLQASPQPDPNARPFRSLLPASIAEAVTWHSLPVSPHLYEASVAAAVSFCAYSWLAKRPKGEGFGLVAFHNGGGYYSLMARGQALSLGRARLVVLMPALAREAWNVGSGGKRGRPGGGGGEGRDGGCTLGGSKGGGLASVDALAFGPGWEVSSLADLERDHMERWSVSAADAVVASPQAVAGMQSCNWSKGRRRGAKGGWPVVGRRNASAGGWVSWEGYKRAGDGAGGGTGSRDEAPEARLRGREDIPWGGAEPRLAGPISPGAAGQMPQRGEAGRPGRAADPFLRVAESAAAELWRSLDSVAAMPAAGDGVDAAAPPHARRMSRQARGGYTGRAGGRVLSSGGAAAWAAGGGGAVAGHSLSATDGSALMPKFGPATAPKNRRGMALGAAASWSSSQSRRLDPVPPLPPLSVHDGTPLVSVCVVHHERGQILFQTLDSVRRQSLPSTQVEVVLVDDGSVTPPALAALDTLATWPEFSSGRWLLLRRPARYLGAARNVAARRARGLFLVFLDDDNLLKPHALATLVGAARASGADILTMPNEKWPSLSPPPDAPWGTPQRWAAATERWLPLGAAPAVGIFRNCFGDANAMVRARVFAALGGFTEDPQIGHEDWELWARAVLRSFRLEVLPEPLYWYRLGAGGMLAKSIGASQSAREQREANFARSLRPYLQRLEGWPEEQELVRSAHGARMAMPQRETERVRPGVE